MQTVACVAAAADGAPPLVLHRMTDTAYATRLQRALKDLACDDHRAPRFPGPNPVSLDTSHFPRLAAEPYYVCEKTDGVRFLMVCCTMDSKDGKLNVCALVDRSSTAYLLPIGHLPRAAYQGTLLDGEAAWNKRRRRWEYLVFDAVCVSGIPVLDGTLKDRLAAAHRVLRVYSDSTPAAAATEATPADPVDLRAKNFVSCTRLEDFEASLGALQEQYDIDGVILTPARTPVTYGRHMGMFKLKFGSKHTVDFLVGEDGRQLRVFDAGAHVAVGSLFPGQAGAAPGSIVECALAAPGTTLWTVVTTRTDKTTANDMFTYQKTLLNMREALDMSHLKRVFGTPLLKSS